MPRVDVALKKNPPNTSVTFFAICIIRAVLGFAVIPPRSTLRVDKSMNTST